jgi:short-subunit dehydrogenase
MGGGKMKESYKDRVVIITGASSGIGREMAVQLAAQGAKLILAARSKEGLKATSEMCHHNAENVLITATDISNEKDCRNCVGKAVAKFGRIDVLINNAGIGMRARFDELMDLTVLKRVVEVNFWGSVYCTHYALPYLKSTRGRIVVVISAGGKFATPGGCGYAASKHAQTGFFDTLRIELQEEGVSVTTAFPEWVATGISSRAPKADGSMAGDIVPHEKNAMTASDCAQKILTAAAKRRREVIALKLKMGAATAPFFPGTIDKVCIETFK